MISAILVFVSAGLCLLLTRCTRRLVWPAVAAAVIVGLGHCAVMFLLMGTGIFGYLGFRIGFPFIYAAAGAAVSALLIALARWSYDDEKKSDEEIAWDEQRRNKIRRIALLAGAAVLVLIAIGDVAFRLVLRSRVNKELNEIRAAGYPVTLEELNAWYPEPPAGQNAADVYQRAIALYADDKGKLFSGNLPPFGDPLPPEMKAMLAAYVAKNREALNLLHQAAAMPLCRFPLDFTKAFQKPAPRLGIMGWEGEPDPSYRAGIREGVYQGVVRLLPREALLYADDRKGSEAAQAIAAMIGAARPREREPIVSSQMAGASYAVVGMQYFQRVLSRTALSDDDLGKIQDLLKEGKNLDGMTRALVAARCIGSAAFTSGETGSALADLIDTSNLHVHDHRNVPGGRIGAYRGFFPISWRLRFLGLLDMDHLYFLRFSKATLKQWQERDSKGGLLRAGTDYSSSPFPGAGVQAICCGFTIHLLSALPMYQSNFAPLITQAELASAAIAVERYRNAQGKLPGNLADLVPAYLPSVPLDPWNGKPVQYKKLAKGYVIYSVGQDRKGNGGNAGTEKDYRGETFLVAR